MKALIAITLIVVGGVLVVAPVFSAEKQKERIAAFYQKNGNGALLPEPMRAHETYDWACLIVGALLASEGVRQAARLRDKPSS